MAQLLAARMGFTMLLLLPRSVAFFKPGPVESPSQEVFNRLWDLGRPGPEDPELMARLAAQHQELINENSHEARGLLVLLDLLGFFSSDQSALPDSAASSAAPAPRNLHRAVRTAVGELGRRGKATGKTGGPCYAMVAFLLASGERTLSEVAGVEAPEPKAFAFRFDRARLAALHGTTPPAGRESASGGAEEAMEQIAADGTYGESQVRAGQKVEGVISKKAGAQGQRRLYLDLEEGGEQGVLYVSREIYARAQVGDVLDGLRVRGWDSSHNVKRLEASEAQLNRVYLDDDMGDVLEDDAMDEEGDVYDEEAEANGQHVGMKVDGVISAKGLRKPPSLHVDLTEINAQGLLRTSPEFYRKSRVGDLVQGLSVVSWDPEALWYEVEVTRRSGQKGAPGRSGKAVSTAQSKVSWDREGLAYWMAAEQGDVLGALAYAFYSMHEMAAAPRFRVSSQRPALLRQPSFLGNNTEPSGNSDKIMNEQAKADQAEVELHDRCRLAVDHLLPHAQSAAEEDYFMVEDPIQRTTLYRVPIIDSSASADAELPHDTKEHADFVRQAASWGTDAEALHEQARIEFQGHYKIGAAPNETKARATLEKAAALGHPESSFTLLLLLLRGESENVDLKTAEPHLDAVLKASEIPESTKAFARHLQYRFGIGVPANKTKAGEFLVEAAELGDLNAQLSMANAYAGFTEMHDVIYPNEVNGAVVEDYTKALHFWRLAVKNGGHSAHFSIGQVILNGEDPNITNPVDQCLLALSHFRETIFAKHPTIVLLHSLARRAFLTGDHAGSLLLYSLLSELGSVKAARNAADLWTYLARQPGSFTPALPCPAAPSQNLTSNADHGGDVETCARSHLRRAAVLGDVAAMHALSTSELRNGDVAAASMWLDVASELGDARGAFELAMLKGAGNRSLARQELWKLMSSNDVPTLVAAALLLVRLHAEELLETRGFAVLFSFAIVAVTVVISALHTRSTAQQDSATLMPEASHTPQNMDSQEEMSEPLAGPAVQRRVPEGGLLL